MSGAATSDGPFAVTAPDGQTLIKGELTAGALCGELLIYGQDGALTQRASYLDGMLHGPMQVYQDGTLQMEANYDRGLLHGRQQLYDEMGRLTASLPFVAGKREGLANFFDQQGRKIREATYRRGKLDGDLIDFDENGGKRSLTQFRAGKREGEMISYYPNGAVRKSWLHLDDNPVGAPRWYDEMGRKMADPEMPKRSLWARLFGG